MEALGGDLMVDDLRSSRPDHRRFVVPRRLSGEPIRSYTRRVDEATAQLCGAVPPSWAGTEVVAHRFPQIVTDWLHLQNVCIEGKNSQS